MTALADYTLFNAAGESVGGGQVQLPDYLDWMPIRVKAQWFRIMEQGHPDTRYVLLKSQGEQLLITEVTLKDLTHEEYKERRNGAEAKTQRYIDQGGFSRIPRNQ